MWTNKLQGLVNQRAGRGVRSTSGVSDHKLEMSMGAWRAEIASGNSSAGDEYVRPGVGVKEGDA
jgi:hypothetical protein